MSNLAAPQVLDLADVEHDIARDVLAYDAAQLRALAEEPRPCPGTLEFHDDLTEFTD
ncbi:hypothetical protein [Xylanimonas oleitrophica]|uniref:hypothetical protein n=1 Tax=Xylanimonas oleitrophica TaxID=2607479 RepID=UPI0015CFE7DC|nr:hypothetical protein [Xylanimonas oleitrophica]